MIVQPTWRSRSFAPLVLNIGAFSSRPPALRDPSVAAPHAGTRPGLFFNAYGLDREDSADCSAAGKFRRFTASGRSCVDTPKCRRVSVNACAYSAHSRDAARNWQMETFELFGFPHSVHGSWCLVDKVNQFPSIQMKARPKGRADFNRYSNYSGFIPISSIIFFCSAVQVPVMSPCCTSSFLLAYISFVVWNSFTLAWWPERSHSPTPLS